MSFIRIMSFNILNTVIPPEDIENFSDVWENRAEYNVAVIRRYRADIIGFQEFDEGHWLTYQDRFPEYEKCIRIADGTPTGNAIFWKRERFDLLESGNFWLTGTPDRADPDFGEDWAVCVPWLLLRDREMNEPFFFFNLQFEAPPDGALQRTEGTKVLVQQVERIRQQSPGAPVVVTGDFNCNAYHEPYLTLLKNGYVDAYRQAGNSDHIHSSSFHGMRGEDYFALEWGNEVFWRVDWIMTLAGTRRFEAVSCSIAHDAQPPLYASDHYPVIAELLFTT